MKPCIKCGAVDRTPRGDCRACAKLSLATWRAANKDLEEAYRAAYRAEHKAATKAYNLAYSAANKDRARAHQIAERKANPAKFKARSAARYARNPKKENARVAAWHMANPGKRKIYNAANPEARRRGVQNRRALRRKVGGILSKGLAPKLLKLQNGICPCCGQPLGADYHLDHRMPLALGGTNTDDNIQLLRARCNLQKGAKHPDDFA